MIIQSPSFLESCLVSVVIPSYNRCNLVGQTIDSILQQLCEFDFEIIIGDDFSMDNSREILLQYQQKYPKNIKLIFHEENIGLGANWATCIKSCRGQYICNCDNDDYWHNPNKIQLQVDFLESHPEYGVCYTNYRNQNRELNQIEEVVVSNDKFNIPLYKAIFVGKFRCCNATMMYRKELFDRYINLDDYINYQFTLQDWNTWIILSYYTDFYCLPISTATFGVETESITRPLSYEKIEQRFKKERECYRYVCNRFPQDLPFDEKGYDNFIFSVLLNLAFEQNNFSKAKELGKKMGSKSIKALCSQKKILFWAYHLLKIIKKINSKN